jgi:hypothetical protein
VLAAFEAERGIVISCQGARCNMLLQCNCFCTLETCICLNVGTLSIAAQTHCCRGAAASLAHITPLSAQHQAACTPITRCPPSNFATPHDYPLYPLQTG